MDKSTTTDYGWVTVTDVAIGNESKVWLVVMGLLAVIFVGYLIAADRRRKHAKVSRFGDDKSSR